MAANVGKGGVYGPECVGRPCDNVTCDKRSRPFYRIRHPQMRNVFRTTPRAYGFHTPIKIIAYRNYEKTIYLSHGRTSKKFPDTALG